MIWNQVTKENLDVEHRWIDSFQARGASGWVGGHRGSFRIEVLGGC